MLWLILGGIILVFAVGVTIDIVRKTKGGKRSGPNTKRSTRNSPALQNFLPIDGFDDSGAMIVKGEYRRLIRIGDVNLYSLATEEIASLRDRFKEMLKRLDNPFQLSVQARRANYTDFVKYARKTVSKTAEEYNIPAFTTYSKQLIQYLEDEAQKPRTDRENLFVVSVMPKMGGESKESKLERLQREQDFVEAGLDSMRLENDVLSPIQQVEAVQNFFSRERAVSQRYRDSFRNRVHAPVVDGAPVEVADIETAKKEA